MKTIELEDKDYEKLDFINWQNDNIAGTINELVNRHNQNIFNLGEWGGGYQIYWSETNKTIHTDSNTCIFDRSTYPEVINSVREAILWLHEREFYPQCEMAKLLYCVFIV